MNPERIRSEEDQVAEMDKPVTNTAGTKGAWKCQETWRSIVACVNQSADTFQPNRGVDWNLHHCDGAAGHDRPGGDYFAGSTHYCACGIGRSRFPVEKAKDDALLEEVSKFTQRPPDHVLPGDEIPVPQESVDRLLSEQHRETVAKLDDQRRRSRLALVQLNEQDLARMLDLPPDLEVVGLWTDPMTRCVNITVRGDDLRPVEPGCHIPNLPGEVQRSSVLHDRVDDELPEVDWLLDPSDHQFQQFWRWTWKAPE